MNRILVVLCFLLIVAPIYLVALPIAILGFISKTAIQVATDHAANLIDWILE